MVVEGNRLEKYHFDRETLSFHNSLIVEGKELVTVV